MNQIRISVKDFYNQRCDLQNKSEGSALDLINFIYTFSTGEKPH